MKKDMSVFCVKRNLTVYLLFIFICLQNGPALSDDTLDKYGVKEIVITPKEKIEMQKYGGFPNSRFFNNETRCPYVVSIFDIPGMSPKHPKMVAFLIYARVKLMEFDLAWPIIKHEPSIGDKLPKLWKALPALYPSFCRINPNQTLEDASIAVYRVARIMATQQND